MAKTAEGAKCFFIWMQLKEQKVRCLLETGKKHLYHSDTVCKGKSPQNRKYCIAFSSELKYFCSSDRLIVLLYRSI